MLPAAHKVFISAAIVLALVFAVFTFRQYAASGEARLAATGFATLAIAGGLVAYLRHFIRTQRR